MISCVLFFFYFFSTSLDLPQYAKLSVELSSATVEGDGPVSPPTPGVVELRERSLLVLAVAHNLLCLSFLSLEFWAVYDKPYFCSSMVHVHTYIYSVLKYTMY